MAIIEYGDLIGDDGTFEELSKNIKELEGELQDLAKALKKTFSSLKPNDTEGIAKAEKDLKGLEQQQKNLVKTEKAMQVAKKKTIDLTNEELIQREKEKLQQRERVQRAKQLAIIQKEEKNNIASIRAQLSLTTLEWKKFTAEELKNTKEGKQLVANKLRLTKTLKKLEQQTDDHRRSVGKYSKSLRGLSRVMTRLFVGRTIIDGIARLGGALVDIVQDGAETNDKFAALVQTFGKAKEFLIGLATTFLNFIAGPLSSLVNTFLFVADAIGKASSEGTFLGSIFSGIGSIFTGVINIINNLPAIFGGVVAAARDFGTTTVNIFKRMALQLEIIFNQINKANPFSDQSAEQIEANIRRIAAEQLALANESIGVQAAFRQGFDDVVKAQEEFNKKQSEGVEVQKDSKAIADARTKAIAAQNSLLQKQKALLESVITSESERVKIIESLQEELAKSEAEGIEDRQARALALEELRFKAEQKQQSANFEILFTQIEAQEQQLIDLFGENSAEVIAFRNQSAKDLLEIEALNQKLSEDQLEESEQKKLDIIKKFEDARVAAVTKTVTTAQALVKKQLTEDEKLLADSIKRSQDSVNEAEDEAAKKRKKTIEERKAANEELIQGARESAEKVGAIIVDLFEKQADLAKKNVDEQEGNLSRARDRAAKGLSANLAFEEQELSKRQLEQQRRQKEAEQAARILTLFNLVSAYAAGGDKNALARGLVDFSLLTALSAGLSGFEEGGYTGSDNSNSAVKGVVHANEYVVTAQDTQRFGLVGKSGGDFGEAMGDYFNPQSPLQTNPYNDQKQAFKQGVKTTGSNNNEMVRELKAIKNHLSKQPNIGIAIEEVYENVYAMIKKESKTNLTKISKKFLRSK